jgi:hypothetical protein
MKLDNALSTFHGFTRHGKAGPKKCEINAVETPAPSLPEAVRLEVKS